jgi:hypothetical protein
MSAQEFEGRREQFGVPEAWDRFSKTNKKFIERVPNLIRARDIAFSQRTLKKRSVDMAVFLLGLLCSQDFSEVLLLCENGYQMAAQKILRGMYERAVTAHYLHMHPDEVDHFFDFHWVADHKLLKAIRETFGDDALDKDRVMEVETGFAGVKADFKVDVCKKCGSTRLNNTWSKLDFVSMARSCGTLGDLIVPAYYFPLQQTHPNLLALAGSVRGESDHELELDLNVQPGLGETELGTAHAILLAVLDLQKEHFQVTELVQPLQVCIQDFVDIKKNGEVSLQTTPE